MKEEKEHVVVALTSFPGAIAYAPGAIRSVLDGSVKPDVLVLYVTLSQFGDKGLPREIAVLAEQYDNFEIRDYDRDIRSYRKLVPALDDFPESVIVTIDDDVCYHRHMLRDLLRLHERYPLDVVAHRVKRVMVGRPYRKWPKYRWYHFLFRRLYRKYGNIQTGVGGVLYPPHSLRPDMIDVGKFVKLAPTADDLWFWAAAVANGRRVIPVPFGRNKPRGLGKPRELSLKTVNFKSGVDRNTASLEAILDAYPEIKKTLDDECK